MFLWDGIVLAAWLWDLLRLPRPEQLEVRRIWEKRPCLGVPGNVVVEVRNGGKKSIHSRIVGETPTPIRAEPPDFGLRGEGGATSEARHAAVPAARRGTPLCRPVLPLHSRLRL